MVHTHPLTAARCADAAALFTSNGTVAGCGCMFFVLPSKEFSAGWSGGNRERLLAQAGSDPPMGLLAYRDGAPIGWCAAGPRERYTRALRSTVLKGRDPAEDPSVWLVTCLYVHRHARRTGVVHELIDGAVEQARAHGAPAIEAFPALGGERRASGEAYIGTEAMFAPHGFRTVARPTPKRVLMRLDLDPLG
jgi:GNAT superfamily N-acetyltransferase